jgi:hypothetical protein
MVSLVGSFKEGEVGAAVASAGSGVEKLCLLMVKGGCMLADNVTIRRVLYGIVRFVVYR